jgi:hypothetical protein
MSDHRAIVVALLAIFAGWIVLTLLIRALILL